MHVSKQFLPVAIIANDDPLTIMASVRTSYNYLLLAELSAMPIETSQNHY